MYHNGKKINEWKIKDLESGSGVLPVQWSVKVGHKTVKLEVRRFENYCFELAIQGVLHNELKSMDDADSDDSFSSSEEPESLCFVDGYG